MQWTWWVTMFALGVALGCFGAWTTNAARVFMKTLAIPGVMLALRLLVPNVAPRGVLQLLIEFFVLVIGAFIGDYLLGLKLGRHGRDGFREDSVGH